VRVPFRSREQRRSRHSEGSESESEFEEDASDYPERGLQGSADLEDTSDRTPRTSDSNLSDRENGDGSPLLEEWHIDAPVSASIASVDDAASSEDAADDATDAAADEERATVSSIPFGDNLRVTAIVSENGEAGSTQESAEEPAASEIQADTLVDSDRVQSAPVKLPRVVAVANQKGGVGKTTTAVNLGAGLAEIGFRVLVIDLDPQGNATTGLGIEARHFENSMYDVIMKDVALEDCIEPTSLKNLFVAPATIDLAGAEIELVPAFSREFKLRKAIQTVVDDFDYVLIDCPPSLGLITINGLAAAGEVLVPIQCEYYALEGLGQLLRNVQLVQSNLNEKLEVSTIVLTMYDARTKLAEQVASEVRAHFGARVCRVVIPRSVRISEAPSFGQPITVFDPTSRGAIAYRELAKEVSGVET
jgi:chromosome partitioning protein